MAPGYSKHKHKDMAETNKPRQSTPLHCAIPSGCSVLTIKQADAQHFVVRSKEMAGWEGQVDKSLEEAAHVEDVHTRQDDRGDADKDAGRNAGYDAGGVVKGDQEIRQGPYV